MKYNLKKELIRMNKDDSSFLSTTYNDSLKKVLRFEIYSFIGRFFSKFASFKNQTKKYLNIGSGYNLLPNFINIDFYNNSFFKYYLSFKFLPKPIPELQHDLRYPLPFSKNRFDGIFSEHTLEHLYPNEVLNLLIEIYRCLKDGGIIRLSLPNTEKMIIKYVNNEPSSDCRTRGEYLNKIYKWGHRAHYDAEFVIYLLETVGFNNVKEVSFGEGQDHNLLVEQFSRKEDSFIVEGTKFL